MRNLPVLVLLGVALSGCGEPVPETAAALAAEEVADTLPLPRPIPLSGPVRETVSGWPAFEALEGRVETLYTARGPEEMTLRLEELTEDFQALDASEYPEIFDLPSVKSRGRVVRTFLLKTQAAIYYRRDYRPDLRQFLEAYNGLREQLNRVESNQLDPTLFQDE